MQSLREELDKVHDQLEAKSREVEAERESRAQVSWNVQLYLFYECIMNTIGRWLG